MHRLIKGIAIAICLQWSLPASAAPVTCKVSKLDSSLIPNGSLATRLTAESYFKVKCSCVTNEVLMDDGGKVKLSIIQNQSNVYNGLAGIRLSGNSGDFGVETLEENYLVSNTEYEQTYSYSVKVSTLNGELLQAKPNYAVAVRIKLSILPTCKTPLGSD
jgi:hypothetical protein